MFLEVGTEYPGGLADDDYSTVGSRRPFFFFLWGRWCFLACGCEPALEKYQRKGGLYRRSEYRGDGGSSTRVVELVPLGECGPSNHEENGVPLRGEQGTWRCDGVREGGGRGNGGWSKQTHKRGRVVRVECPEVLYAVEKSVHRGRTVHGDSNQLRQHGKVRERRNGRHLVLRSGVRIRVASRVSFGVTVRITVQFRLVTVPGVAAVCVEIGVVSRVGTVSISVAHGN